MMEKFDFEALCHICGWIINLGCGTTILLCIGGAFYYLFKHLFKRRKKDIDDDCCGAY